MLTRGMSQELNDRVEELEQLLERQRLQIDRLINRRADADLAPQPAPARFDITRVPDIIKVIPGYDGDTKGLPAWINSVEQKLNCAKSQVPDDEKDRAEAVYTSVIRDKISGKANEILLNNQTSCNWADIKAQLIDRFGDKRDLASILNKIPYIKQGNRSVDAYYDECTEILSDVNAKVILDNALAPCAKVVMASYEAILTTAFVDGLHEPISSLTRTSKPNSLLAAYQHALEQDNAAKRQRERNKTFFKVTPEPPKLYKPIPNRNGTWNQNFRPPSQTQNLINPRPQIQYRNPYPYTYPYPTHQHPFQPQNPNRNQNPQTAVRQIPAIKQEATSTSNIRNHPHINTHDEQVISSTDECTYIEQVPTDEGYQDLSLEVQPIPEDLNFQLPQQEDTET